jgi:hypothetical protein
MATRAYDELYLTGAQNILGHAVDFAVMSLEIDPDVFGKALAVAACAKQFAEGNPRYVAGMNGCELARAVLDDVGFRYRDREDAMYLDKSPEYWAGWALAYYQWFTALPFMDILQAVPLEDIIRMYPLYHEMDIARFVEQMNRRMKTASPQTRLRRRRCDCGLSQAALSSAADVPLRQIQLFEQGQRDINKTSAVTLYKLGKALHCRMEDLMEPNLS